MKMKGQIPILEMITVTIILLIAFSVFFPGLSYKNRWSDAMIMLKGRDIVLVIDRLGKIHDYSFNSDLLKNFLNIAIPEKNLIYWSEVDETIKQRIVVACNCTEEQIGDLIVWVGRERINNRDVDVDIVLSNLDKVQQSDVLLIWGERDLSPYKNQLLNYLSLGNGIIEIADIVNPDQIQKEVFGIARCSDFVPNCGWGRVGEIKFFKPKNSSQLTYEPYKLFYHIPILLRAPNTVLIVPVENGIQSCAISANQGEFRFGTDSYVFWICGMSVYFDTDGNNQADKIVTERTDFFIGEYNFFLNYVYQNRIFVSFRPEYKFEDFVKDGNTRLFPADGNLERIFLYRGHYANDENRPIPAVIINGSISAKTVWIADFTDGGVNDDEKLLIGSLILSSANKKSTSPVFGILRYGFLTSYINTVNYDMFESYQFKLGLGFPF